MSLDLEIRLRMLQTGNRYRLDLVNRRAEMELHRRLGRRRVTNFLVREWFDLDEGIAEVDDAFAGLR